MTLIGELGGVIDLPTDNGFSRFTSMKIGNTGSFHLASCDRRIILDPDLSRILNPYGERTKGANRLFEQVITGFEVPGAT